MTNAHQPKWSVDFESLGEASAASNDEDLHLTGYVPIARSVASVARDSAVHLDALANLLPHLLQVLSPKECQSLAAYLSLRTDELLPPPDEETRPACERLQAMLRAQALESRECEARYDDDARQGQHGGGPSPCGSRLATRRVHGLLRLLYKPVLQALQGAATRDDEVGAVVQALSQLLRFATEPMRIELGRCVERVLDRTSSNAPSVRAREVLRAVIPDLDASAFNIPNILCALELDDRSWQRILRDAATE